MNAHRWNFVRIGGLDQALVETGEDLVALRSLDQKLWVALACPVKGLEIDEGTLARIDRDKDGRIRVGELLGAIDWALQRVKEPAQLLAGHHSLPLDAINHATPEGAAILAAARQTLAYLGRSDQREIALADVIDPARIYAGTRFNGDGIVTAASAADDAVAAEAIADIVGALAGEPDRSGSVGVGAAKLAAFFAAAADHIAWREQGEQPAIQPLGPATPAAAAAVAAARTKVDDYFARVRLAAYDPRSLASLNRKESELASLAEGQFDRELSQLASFPLSPVEPAKPLPLGEGINPAWQACIERLKRDAIVPLFGDKTTLTEAEWRKLVATLSPYEAWAATKGGEAVAGIGLKRLRDLLASDARERIAALIAQDEALRPQAAAIQDVETLLRYARDFRPLLRNFVNFLDFYSPDQPAVFQTGSLFLDGRATELCVRVDNPAAHTTLAGLSRLYLAYCDCKRPSTGETMTIAAAFTQGDGDYLMPGRNGVFYDRKGRDWDATIVRIQDNPISIGQAAWMPYKKFVRFIEEQVAKRAAAADSASTSKLESAAATTADAAQSGKSAAAPKKFDVGTIAALGVGVGALGTLLAGVFGGFIKLGIYMPIGLLGVVMLISGPSMLIAWLKLRQRTLGPLLDASGWAINGRIKINVPFGASLTTKAQLPPGSHRSLRDPYVDRAAMWRRRLWLSLAGLLAASLVAAATLGTWPFSP
jgi:hypothetical protein